jgi:peptide/nickel transport system substrate-binding protein
VKAARLTIPFAAFLLAATASSGGIASPSRHSGGTLRVRFLQDVPLDFATTFDSDSWAIAYATCTNLMTYPDRPGQPGTRPRPDAAVTYPTVSNGGKKFTFRVRRGLRFQTGTRITAANYAAAIDRDLDPAMYSPAGDYLHDVVGAARVAKGKATHASGVIAHGRRLVIHLREAHPDLVFRLAMPFFCPIPVQLPHDPTAVDHLPGSGPYYVAAHVPNRKIVLARNRFYRGWRAHRPARIAVSIGGDPEQNFQDVKKGLLDVTPNEPPADELPQLVRRYGLNRSRLFTVALPKTRLLALNASRPLFRNNPKLRRAVSYAINRTALTKTLGYVQGAPRDQLLPSVVAGFHEAHIYPLHRAQLKKARLLAHGHRRSGRAVLYTSVRPDAVLRAQILKQELARIGIRVKIEEFPRDVFFEKITRRGARFDIADYAWFSDYPDPRDFIQALVDGRRIRAFNNSDISYYDNRAYDRRMEAAARLSGARRYRAFGRLDHRLMREAAPYAPYATEVAVYFVSHRVGCVVRQPYFAQDYAAYCLKR